MAARMALSALPREPARLLWSILLGLHASNDGLAAARRLKSRMMTLVTPRFCSATQNARVIVRTMAAMALVGGCKRRRYKKPRSLEGYHYWLSTWS
jgi:hypothetical protein